MTIIEVELWKLTDQFGFTMNKTEWGENVTHVAPGGGSLCSKAWLHAYEGPELALFLNPIGAAIEDPLLWKARGIVGIKDNGLKVGCTKLTTIVKVYYVPPTITHAVAFGILCALEVYHKESFVAWANRWLSNRNRDRAAAAKAAADAASAYADAAAAAAYAAATAADYAAAADADAAAYAAAAAAHAAAHAAKATPINLIQIAQTAMNPRKRATPCSSSNPPPPRWTPNWSFGS